MVDNATHKSRNFYIWILNNFHFWAGYCIQDLCIGSSYHTFSYMVLTKFLMCILLNSLAVFLYVLVLNFFQMTEVLKAGVLSDEIDLGALAHNAAEEAEDFVRKVWEASWKVCHFRNLPQWLQDNDYLHAGHRPPLHSFLACFKSIFRIHTETGNIWSHLLGKCSKDVTSLCSYVLYGLCLQFANLLSEIVLNGFILINGKTYCIIFRL